MRKISLVILFYIFLLNVCLNVVVVDATTDSNSIISNTNETNNSKKNSHLGHERKNNINLRKKERDIVRLIERNEEYNQNYKGGFEILKNKMENNTSNNEILQNSSYSSYSPISLVNARMISSKKKNYNNNVFFLFYTSHIGNEYNDRRR